MPEVPCPDPSPETIMGLKQLLARERADHAATVAELRDLLRRFEWRERTVNGVVVAFSCPSCGVLQGMDHVDGCRLHNALAATPAGSATAAVLAAADEWFGARQNLDENEEHTKEQAESLLDNYLACKEHLEDAVAAWRAARGDQGGTGG